VLEKAKATYKYGFGAIRCLMRLKFCAMAAFLLLLAAAVSAAPAAPEGLRAEIVSQGVMIAWDYGENGVEFNVRRGSSVGDANVIATVSEKFFTDSTGESDVRYVYLVTAFDETSESAALGHVSLVYPPKYDRPFTLKIVQPVKRTFYYGERVNFVVEVESEVFDKLEGLKAVLSHNEMGVVGNFALNEGTKQFTLSLTLPSEGEFKELSIDYKIYASALIGPDGFSETLPLNFVLSPQKEIDTMRLATNLLTVYGPFIVLLFIATTVAFVGWRWSLHRKGQSDSIRLDLLGVLKERTVWKQDFFRRRVSQQQYAEKERELQGRENALRAKLAGKKIAPSKKNLFEGYRKAEVEEIYRLFKSLSSQKSEMNKDSVRTWLLSRGKSERVAKKVTDLIFEGKGLD